MGSVVLQMVCHAYSGSLSVDRRRRLGLSGSDLGRSDRFRASDEPLVTASKASGAIEAVGV